MAAPARGLREQRRATAGKDATSGAHAKASLDALARVRDSAAFAAFVASVWYCVFCVPLGTCVPEARAQHQLLAGATM